MSRRVSLHTSIELEYWKGHDIAGLIYSSSPVEPEHTNERRIAVRSDDSHIDPRSPAISGRRQVHFAGTRRALEAFGKYLIALARLETADPSPHEHFEAVQNDDGGTVHLIVRRLDI